MDIYKDKEAILLAGLQNVPFDGWSKDVFVKAATDNGMDDMIVDALFPRGTYDIMDFFASWADDQMLESLKSISPDDLKIRARIRIAVEKRMEALAPYKEAVHICMKKCANPQFTRLGMQMTWRTADVIWQWAGDTATDYNRYTKRGLLAGVIGATMAYWMRDHSDDAQPTKDFLNNRIENVVQCGQSVGKIIKPLEGALKNFIVPKVKDTLNNKI